MAEKGQAINPLVELMNRFKKTSGNELPRLSPTRRQGTAAPTRERFFPDQRYEAGSSARFRHALQPDWRTEWGSPFQAEMAHPNDPRPPMAMGTTPTDRVRAFHAERALRNLVSRTRQDINAQGFLERLILNGDVGNKTYTPLKTPAMRDTRSLLGDLMAPDMGIRQDAWADADTARGAGIHHPYAEQAAWQAQLLDEARQRGDSVIGPQIRDSEVRARKANPPRFAGTGESAYRTLLRGGGGMALGPISDIQTILMSAITGTSPIAATLAAYPAPGMNMLYKDRRTGKVFDDRGQEYGVSPSGGYSMIY